VDLQLAYLAAPQNAAQVSAAQTAPEIAQQAAQATFAAQVREREESVAQTDHAERTVLRTTPDGGGGAEYTPQERRRRGGYEQKPDESSALGFAGDEHFIDVTA
jgi:hypothetical protein